MNKKGFTLVELIGVVVILGLIALVAFPALLNQINDSKKQVSDSQKNIIISAAKTYVEDNKNEFADKDYFIIDMEDLIKGDYINKQIVSSYIDENNKVLITFFNGDYVVTASTSNSKCQAVTNLTITSTGSVPTKSNPFVAGAEYKCFVNEKESYQFYVLDSNDDNVMLIMNQTFKNSSTNWCKDNNNNNCGAITAKKVLAEKTASWEIGSVLPDKNFLVKANGGSEGTAASWMVTNMSDKDSSYWTSTPSNYKNDGTYAYAVYYSAKRLNTVHPVGTYKADGSKINITYGIRPVIIVSKEMITYPQ